MTTFDRGDVERLAHLARLELSEGERATFARQLAAILAFAEQVAAVDTEGVPPTSQLSPAAGPLRDDAPAPSLARDDVLRQASGADRAAGLFTVPRVLGS
ncbi:MAG TPA: Asp-tRNA(Asn)/Glu-tRNA(Gln) amidotransferase subunit GatC [Vicinamibacterales bacterium]|nr:Asp-tRNA(Asn)/Glu-tRNA(Gln) amidotransferase subunit GatC [Vicinamibacterales bacterium]